MGYLRPMPRYFNTTGPCDPADHYALPTASRLPNLQPFFDRKQYFVLHAPRQTGKTTAMLTLAQELTQRGTYAAVLVGSTATAAVPALHTASAVRLADGTRIACGTVINADAMQTYDAFPILTAQPTVEERARVPHALYGVLASSETLSAARWLPEFGKHLTGRDVTICEHHDAEGRKRLLRNPFLTRSDQCVQQCDPALTADRVGLVLHVVGANAAVTAIRILPVGILTHLATDACFEGISSQAKHLHDALTIAVLRVFLLVQGLQITSPSGYGIQQHHVVPFHAGSRIRHDLR